MSSAFNPYSTPASNVDSSPLIKRKRKSIDILYHLPAIIVGFGCFVLFLTALKDKITYHFWLILILLLFVLPIGFALSALSKRFVAKWHGINFWSYIVLAGISWSLVLYFALITTAIIVWKFIGFDSKPLPFGWNNLKELFNNTIDIYTGIALFCIVIHAVCSIYRKNRTLQSAA